MDDRRVFQELVRGREFANQLRQVMNEHDNSSSNLLQTLAKNVLRSFTNTLFLFDKYPTYESHELSQIQQQHSQESCKRVTPKNRRGCYKRKRTTEEWERVSETPIVDGHQWRKYGQKAILEAKYSRNYYRCSHRYDQKCQASKQVQRIQEEPPLYKTTYFGHHTCNNELIKINSKIILDSNSSAPDTSILLSFNNTIPNPTNQECPFLSSFHPSPSLNKEEVIPSPSSNDYFLSPKPTSDNSSMHDTNDVTLSPHHWDAISTFCDSVDLDDAYHPFGGL
ncbi:WRKY DNA-binding transcription factor 70 [Cajanus cajan]|uniref:WRKY transcription factor 70 n=1 Tax=Cajanus cajan TaxID=3821 RepID=A0A151UBJ3_CAJCA|nr:WRKY DNA-binding transcription factor 70 [Cajanus cajan]KYP76652.1 putative WRKY transcription factor 70 [Cajanus cajan]